MRQAVRPLARKLASRVSQQRRRHQRGRVDMRRTIRRSLDSGGVPMDVAYGAVARASPTSSCCATSPARSPSSRTSRCCCCTRLQSELSGLRCFVFVDGVAEVTSVLADRGGAPRSAVARHVAGRDRRRRAQRLRERVPAVPRRAGHALRAGHDRDRRRRRPHELPARRASARSARSASECAASTGSTPSRRRVGHRRLRAPALPADAAPASSRCAACRSSPTPSPTSSEPLVSWRVDSTEPSAKKPAGSVVGERGDRGREAELGAG